MPTRTEIVEVGAVAVCLGLGHRDGGSECEIDHTIAEAALTAMLPLIKEALADSVRGQVNQRGLFQDENTLGKGIGLYQAARIIERYEPAP